MRLSTLKKQEEHHEVEVLYGDWTPLEHESVHGYYPAHHDHQSTTTTTISRPHAKIRTCRPPRWRLM